ncbi:hypothetical protein [uncultured Roseibium sp.]|uniref:hypothetical protein n=1 Tax=uncultured Roseibium sp. TaxID=1936171 RepID=UPI00321620DC
MTWLFLASCLAMVPAANAQEAETIALELNKADTVDGACRVTLVVKNSLTSALDALRLDMVIFDKSGGVAGYAGIDFGAIPQGKTLVRQYNVAQIDCGTIVNLLVNDIRSCERADKVETSCLPHLELKSRTDIGFIL